MKPLFPLSVGAMVAPCLLALSASHSFAQASTTASSPPGFELPRVHAWANVIHDEPGDGRLWALGASWKASFGADGVVYYPRIGPSEPRRLPHALSPDLVTIGGVPIAFERTAHAVRRGDRVELDRRSFIERYDVALDAVEQSFVFDTLPGAGDLVLRIPVASELVAVETDAGLEFRSEKGRITYSRAVAVDAHGRRTTAATHIEDGAITIRVAADVLAEAAFPLVIDPVLNSIHPETVLVDVFSADAAYDPFNQVWILVYESVFSASDHDVIAKVYSSTGTFIAQNSPDLTADSWVDPRVADLAGAHKFLVVAGATAATNGAKTVRGRILQPNGTLLTMDPQIAISGAASTSISSLRPDVGGDPSLPTPGSWCVVFQRGPTGGSQEIVYCLVSSGGSIPFGPIGIPHAAGTSDGVPSISKSNDSSAWLVVWEHNLSLSWSIQGARIAATGPIITSTFTIGSGTLISDPKASSPLYGTNRYAVVYQAGIPVGSQDSTIVVALIEGGTVLQLANLMTLENSPTAGDDQFEAGVDSDGTHFLVSYQEEHPVPYFSKVYVTDLAVAGNTLQVSQAHVELPGGAVESARINVAAARVGGALAHRYLTVFDTWFPIEDDHDVYGWFVEGNVGGPTSLYCFGDGAGTPCPCGNSGWGGHGCANSVWSAGAMLAMSAGQPSTIADTAVMEVLGVPFGATGLFFQGTTAGAGAPFGDGLLCATGTTVRLAVKTANSAGVLDWPQPGDPSISVAGAVPEAGGLRTYQFWYRDSASFCTSAVFNLTNGVAIQWAR